MSCRYVPKYQARQVSHRLEIADSLQITGLLPDTQPNIRRQFTIIADTITKL
jgi:hypothetical protein